MGFSLGEYQDIFLEEADEQLQELNQNLLELERNPHATDIINNIFRAAHSLKSSAAFVGLNGLSELAHKMENLLQGIRDKTLTTTPEIIEVLFKCFDVISNIISTVSAGEEPTQDLRGIIAEIERVSAAPKGGAIFEKAIEKKSGIAEKTVLQPSIEFTPEERNAIKKGLEGGVSCCELSINLDKSALMKSLKLRLILNNLEHIAEIVKTIPSQDEIESGIESENIRIILLTDHSLDEIKKACDVDQVVRIDSREISLVRKDGKVMLKFHAPQTIAEEVTQAAPSSHATADVPDVGEEQANEIHDEEDEEQEKSSEDRVKVERKASVLKTVKVSVDKLDQLLNNVGELVIANSGFYKLYEELRKHTLEKSLINEFKNRMEQMSRIAKDLQSGIMKTRMVPIGGVFSRFHRLVRDLNKEFGKKVQLKILGEETELDKKVIDAIGEPLMHLIRNAVDHGIEDASERKRLGKSEIATITLNAYQGGNQIFVEVSDDGRGLDLEEIKKTALQNNLATPEMIANMDKEDIYNFIFRPGFSTKKEVTDISGRGVGMNVVKEIVSELNGSVQIETEPGMGTRFVMVFPLTLAIIPAIMVRISREIYAVPLSDVIETIKISADEIQTIEGHEVINLRGEILSLLRLNRFFKIKSSLTPDQKIPVVVVGFGNRKIGLVVDDLEGKQEIVIKSLEQNYRTVEGLAGASILGDGSICLILDISSMMNKVLTDQNVILDRDEEDYFDYEKEYGEVEQRTLVGVTAEAKAPERVAEIKTSVMPEVPSKEVGVTKEEFETREYRYPVDEKEISLKSRVEPIELEDDFKIISEEIESEGITPSYAQEEIQREAKESEEEIERKVKEALHKFKEELRQNIEDTIIKEKPAARIIQELKITDDDLDRVRVLANVGITNAAENLSKILGRRVDLSIPDVRFIRIDKIPETIGAIDNVYIGVYVPFSGKVNGTILFSFNEENGFDLIDTLWGLQTGKTRELTEDGESALKELGNIVG
ncbi:MAG: chemotaxis protein CheW [Spirochaetes bacterium]|nr:chemotaxis protein CheW [Spirochaetota bacterium]